MGLKYLNLIKKFLVIGALALFLAVVQSAEAADISFQAKSYSENGKQLYKLEVFLDTKGESINALEGEMNYPDRELNFEKIADGGSIVNFWIESPRRSSNGKITFSGGMPGGYKGDKGFLFSVTFSAPKDDSSFSRAEMSIRNFKFFLNDGEGTQKEVPSFTSSLDFEKTEVIPVPIDSKPPEVFAPYLTQDSNLADGQWAVIINAQDKGEGISHYEIFESDEEYAMDEVINDTSLPWKIVDDPSAHVLQNQKLENYVYVKAVDRAGNERVAMVTPAISKKGFNFKVISVIIIVSMAVFIIFFEAVLLRKKKLKLK